MNITAEEIVEELKKMLNHMKADYLYTKKVQGMIERLETGSTQDLSSKELIEDLRLTGFPDLANKLVWKGGIYGK